MVIDNKQYVCVVRRFCVNAGQVTAVTLVPEPFSIENDLLTPTMKLKRPQAKKVFQEAIQQMYARTGSGA